MLLVGAAIGWTGNFFAGWWKLRDRYRVHVTWRTLNNLHGEQDFPVVVIQSIHSLPINVTGVRIRNGFRWNTGLWAFDSDEPDYPTLPRTIDPMKESMFVLSSHALDRAAAQSWPLKWLWVSRVYVGVQTLGRGERIFTAERGLVWKERRKRFQR